MSARESNYSAWIAKAENDFRNIENNLNARTVPWDTVCFHAQQAAEKLLKAFLIYHSQLPTRTHDLVALLAMCTEFEKELGLLEESCRKLTVYAVGARYPDDLFEPSKGDGLAMVEAAKTVREMVMRLLGVARNQAV